MRPNIYPFRTRPGQIIGFRKDGRPIHAIAGGSETAPEGTTISVPVVPKPEPPPNTQVAPPAATNGNGNPPQQVTIFSAADIEAARQQEKDKLYPRLATLEEQAKALSKERDERLAKETAARKEAEKAAEAARLENLTFLERLTEVEKAGEERANALQARIDQQSALLEHERAFQQLQEFRGRRLAEESEAIMPELHPWVTGTSEEDIEAAISRAKETTASIVAQVTSAQQQQQVAEQQARQQARGTGVTAPPVGPMENQSGYETFTADDIRDMDMATYAKNRGRLLGAASQQNRGRG